MAKKFSHTSRSKQARSKQVIIIGGGVAGTEAGTYIGQKADEPIEVIEIEADENRRFGGWGFQSFPASENTNLAMCKMYLGDNPNEILDWAADTSSRGSWPEKFKNIELSPNRTFPRALMKAYVKWRRDNISNDHVTYRHINGEAMHVIPKDNGRVEVRLESGRAVEGDQLIIASGSISVKVPDYLHSVTAHPHVIVDPLTQDGDARRANIPANAKILVLGTGLTGEEQANILLQSGHKDITVVSRGGLRHYPYPEEQISKPLQIEKPDFIVSPPATTEEFIEKVTAFFLQHFQEGYSPEDIHTALRPYWEETRAILGRCERAAEILYKYRRPIAVFSIGSGNDVVERLDQAEKEGTLKVAQGYIQSITDNRGKLDVSFSDVKDGPVSEVKQYDYIINAVGRNILQHSMWDNLLKDGLATKHAGIGVMVHEDGRMRKADSTYSENIWVMGMPRAGDHTLRHGYLGNFAFNVPQVREHCYKTVDALLEKLKNTELPELANKWAMG